MLLLLIKKSYKKEVIEDFKKPKMEYIVPDMKTLPDNEYGKLVKYGKELIVHTYKYIGPEVEDPSMRYAGNNNSCQNCHLDAGTKNILHLLLGLMVNFHNIDQEKMVLEL